MLLGARAPGAGEETTTRARKTTGEAERAGEAEGRGETQRDRKERGMKEENDYQLSTF